MRIRAALAALLTATVLTTATTAASADTDATSVAVVSQMTPPVFSPAAGQTWTPLVTTTAPVTWTLTLARPATPNLPVATLSSTVAATRVAPLWNGRDATGKAFNEALAWTLALTPATGEPTTLTGAVTVIGIATTVATSTPAAFTPDGDASAPTWNPVFTASRPVTWTVTLTKTTGPGVGSGSSAWGGYTNGKIADSALCALSWAPAHRLRCDAAAGMERTNKAYRATFGTNISVTDTYRPYADQVAVYQRYGYPRAAIPGTSDHGWALAADLGGGINTFGTAQYTWMKAHAPQYGWVHPARAEPDGKYPEPWHWVWETGRGEVVASYRQESPAARFAPVWNGTTNGVLNADGTYTWTAVASDGAAPALTRTGAVVLRARGVYTTVRTAALSSDNRTDGRAFVSWSAPATVGVTGWNVSYRRVTTSSTGKRVYGTTYRWLTNTKENSRVFNGTAGRGYEFLVTAVDTIRPKNPTSSAITSLTIDDRSLAYSSGWVNQSLTGRYRSTVKASATKGRTASLAFYGTGVTVVGERSPITGQFYVSVDGARPVLVDTYATSTRVRQHLFSKTLNGGRHTVKITVVGTAKRPTVRLDGIGVAH